MICHSILVDKLVKVWIGQADHRIDGKQAEFLGSEGGS